MKPSIIVTIAATALCACFTTNGQQRSAADPWWFEVEAIVFERDVDVQQLNEEFPLEIKAIDNLQQPDFITPVVRPDFRYLHASAPTCLEAEAQVAFPLQTHEAPKLSSLEDIMSGRVPVPIDVLERLEGINENFLDSIEGASPFEPVPEAELTATDELFSDLLETNDLVSLPEPEPEPALEPKYPLVSYPIKAPGGIRLPDTLYCQWPEEKAFFLSEFAKEIRYNFNLDRIPKFLNGIETPFSQKAYALPTSALQLKNLRRRIDRKKGLNVLLHTAWRQDVKIGRDKAPWYRFYGGHNLREEYLYNGLPVPEEKIDSSVNDESEMNIFDKIEAVLSGEKTSISPSPGNTLNSLISSELNQKFQQVWTFDGQLKVFIEYIGGTPYLHVDSELNFRKPKFIDWQAIDQPMTATSLTSDANETTEPSTLKPDANFLQAYHFDQIRRLISKEIHYFDHPVFGMVIQIRRHRRPNPELPADYYN